MLKNNIQYQGWAVDAKAGAHVGWLAKMIFSRAFTLASERSGLGAQYCIITTQGKYLLSVLAGAQGKIHDLLVRSFILSIGLWQ